MPENNTKIVSKTARVQLAARWPGVSTTARWIKVKTVTTVTEWRGLSLSEANAMIASSTYNYSNKSDYKIGEWRTDPYVEPETVLLWSLTAPNAQGDESHADMKPHGDSNLYMVSVVLTQCTCTGSHGVKP